MKLSNQELLQKAFTTTKTEQAAALKLLEYLAEIDSQKLYTIKAYSSLFEYLVRELQFSEMQAYERVNVVRLMRAIPTAKESVKEKIQQGDLTNTTVSQVQRFFNQEKKAAARVISDQEKIEILESVSGKSKREVEKVLFSLQSEPARILTKEKSRVVSESLTELKFQIQEETVQKLNEVKDLLGHESLAKIFDEGLNELLQKIKKKQGRDGAFAKPDKTSKKSAFPGNQPSRSRYISIHTKRVIYARSKGQCEYESPEGSRCQSRYRLHLDHVKPFSTGGENEANNLRHLCAQHNWKAAMDAGLA